jgi:hypothetical protein
MPITKRHRDKDLPSQKEWQERTRQKIRDRKLVDKSLDVVDGKTKMDAGQLAVLKMLLPTILPTMSETSIEQVTPQAIDLPALKAMLHGNTDLLDALGLMVKPDTQANRDNEPIPVSH